MQPTAFIRTLSTLMLCGLVASCSDYTATLRVDIDPGADFTQYRSYAFYSQPGRDSNLNDPPRYSSLQTLRLKDAIDDSMRRAGYVYDDRTPDLLINFDVTLKDRVEVEPAPATFYGPVYGFGGWPYYNAWVGYQPIAYSYTESFLTIDLVEAKRGQLVWQGVVSQRLDSPSQQNSSAFIDAAVEKIFARYPFRAGGGHGTR